MSAVHPVVYPMGTEVAKLGLRWRGVKLTTHCIKCRGQEFVELYHHCHVRVYGVVLNCQMGHFTFSSLEDDFCKSGCNNSGRMTEGEFRLSVRRIRSHRTAHWNGVSYYLLLTIYTVFKRTRYYAILNHTNPVHTLAL